MVQKGGKVTETANVPTGWERKEILEQITADRW